MLDNTAEMVEAQQGVAMSGATLGSVNTRLDAATVAYVLEHSDARLFIADERYEATCREALATLENPPALVVVGGQSDGYEALVESGDAAAPWTQPEDEWDALALNYTSGTVWKSNLRFTPSTRRLLDGVAMSVPHRSTEPEHPTHWLIPTQASLASSPSPRCRAPCRRSARSCSRTTATTWRRLSRSTSSTRRPLLEEIDDEDVTGTAEDACRPRGGVGSA